MNMPTDLKQMISAVAYVQKTQLPPMSIPRNEINLCLESNARLESNASSDALVTQAAKTNAVTKDERKKSKQI